MNYFVTAIGTDSGKTLVSTILAEALQADYWKPIQSGKRDRDVETVKRLLNNGHSICHEEHYLLTEPISPHAAAKRDGVDIKLNEIKFPNTNGNHLVIEGAGGIMVPLNDKEFIVDLISMANAEVVLVSNHYLGSINHTLLTVQELKRRNIPVKGIVFNGEPNEETEKIILAYSEYKFLLRVLPEKSITQEVIMKYAIKLFENWDE